MSHLYLIFSFKLCFSAAPGSKKSHPYRCSANGWDTEMNDPGRSSCCCMLLCQKIPIFHFYLTRVPSSTRSSSVIASRGLTGGGVRDGGGSDWQGVLHLLIASIRPVRYTGLILLSLVPLSIIMMNLKHDLSDHEHSLYEIGKQRSHDDDVLDSRTRGYRKDR